MVTIAMSTGQQVILAILLMLGNPIMISVFTLVFRMYIFERRFKDIVQSERDRKMKATGAVVGMAGAMFGLPVMSNFRSEDKTESKTRRFRSVITRDRDQANMPGMGAKIGASPEASGSSKSKSPTPSELAEKKAQVDLESAKSPFLAPPKASSSGMPMSPGGRSIKFLEPITEGEPSQATGLGVSSVYQRDSPQVTRQKSAVSQDNGSGRSARSDQDQCFSIDTFLKQNKVNVGRNGQFHNLTAREREYLGGVEYRAIKLLIVTVTVYFFLWQLLGAIALGAWIAVNNPSAAGANAQNPWWTGVFIAISAFNNGGMTLLDAGIAAFEGAWFLLVATVLLMLAGSAAFPAFLRLILWCMAQLLKYGTHEEDYAITKETLDFTLKYPRRVYTMLFPSKPTWLLVAMLVFLVTADWIALSVLSIGNPSLDTDPSGERVFNMLFQSICKPRP